MKDYLEWCEHLTTALTKAAYLLQVDLNQWEAYRANGKLLCPICHNENDFVSEEFVFGGETFSRYHCQSCGDEMTLSFTGRQAYGQSFGDELFSYQY